jgi:hypothetical protein
MLKGCIYFDYEEDIVAWSSYVSIFAESLALAQMSFYTLFCIQLNRKP